MSKHLDDISLGKFLSLILRHKPEEIGLTLNNNGYADVDEMIRKINQHGIYIDFDILQRIVINNDKQRYSFNEDCSKIRANQGHSLKVDLQLTEQEPPAILYHGTATRFVKKIKLEGIKKISRQYVHLSKDVPTAQKVGQRHGKVIVLPIDALSLYKSGQKFYLSENKVWLTEDIAPQFILWELAQ